MSENYFIDTGRGLAPAAPARIVCFDEGDGEWTIEAQDADGRAIRDERGDYLSVWHDEEALDDFRPMTRDEAIAAAVALASEMGLPTLPAYAETGDSDESLPGGEREWQIL